MSEDEIKTGVTTLGAPWAMQGVWRVTAYADDGYTVWRLHAGTPECMPWIITRDCPIEIERALCQALGLTCKR